MKKQLLYFIIGSSMLFFACDLIDGGDDVDRDHYLLENRGTFKAKFDGIDWEGKRITANLYDGELDVGAGQGSDTIIFLDVSDAEIKTYVRDTLNPSESAHWQMIQVAIRKGEKHEFFPWLDGELTILRLTSDTLEAEFNFAIKNSVITNGYTKLYLGD